jgi:putative ABC transport system substrate-binding protein
MRAIMAGLLSVRHCPRRANQSSPYHAGFAIPQGFDHVARAFDAACRRGDSVINRRSFIGAGTPALLITPWGAEAQPAGKVYRIGYLSAPTRASVENALGAFLRTLRELGWVEGQNLIIEYRWAEGKVERLPELAAELVRSKVDVIVAPAGSAALAAKGATSSIPIVMMFSSDPVATGLVASLSRPGGNVTGTSFALGPEIFGKQLQVLKEVVPNASRVAILVNPADQASALQLREVEVAARSLGMRLQHVEARGPEELDNAFAAMARERAEALVVGRDATFLVHRARLAELAMKGRLPTVFNFRESVEAGGLMAYAVNMSDFIGRAAGYVDKILRGAKPADLPVEQPTKFELVINAKTARALGLTFPQSLLLRADEVIQ